MLRTYRSVLPSARSLREDLIKVCCLLLGWQPGDPIPGVDAGAPTKAPAVTGKEGGKQPEEHAELPMFELILNPEWEDAEEEFSDEEESDE